MQPALRTQHHTPGPMVFEGYGDEAVAEGYSVTYLQGEESIAPWSPGFNRWTFERIEGRSYIKRRLRREVGADIDSAVTAAARGVSLLSR